MTRVEIFPDIKEQSKREYTRDPKTGKKVSLPDRYLREAVAKGNTGTFYAHLYGALFGGDVALRYKGGHDILPSGEKRNLSPDIKRKTKNGLVEVEVKSISRRDSRWWVGREQAENYWYRLCERLIEEEVVLPWFEMGMFRYGPTNDLPYLGGYTSGTATRKMCGQTRDLIVLPANLALLALFLTEQKKLGKNSSKSQTKGIIQDRFPVFVSTNLLGTNPLGFLCSLGDPEFPKISRTPRKRKTRLEEISPRERGKLILERLMVDKVRVRTYSSDDLADVVCEGNIVQPFKIREFTMTKANKLEWLNQFRLYHKELLVDLIGIRDLYYENYEERGDAIEPTEEELQEAESSLEKEGLPFG